jgi:hypothetical protein
MGFPCTGELLEEYQLHWTCKIGGEVVLSQASLLTKADAKDSKVDIIFGKEIHVKANKEISIAVRYQSLDEDAFMC